MPHLFNRSSRACVASIVLSAAALIGGCASPNGSGSPTTTPSPATPHPPAASAPPPRPTPTPVAASARQPGRHAECLVCKENADLACVDLTVDKDTPHTDYNGKTYY